MTLTFVPNETFKLQKENICWVFFFFFVFLSPESTTIMNAKKERM